MGQLIVDKAQSSATIKLDRATKFTYQSSVGQLDGWKLTLPADTQSRDLFIYQYTNKDDLASV